MEQQRLRAAAAALLALARAPRCLGAPIGRGGGVPTGTRAVRAHPHVPSLVPGGDLADDGRPGGRANPAVLLHRKPRAARVRATRRAALRQTARWSAIPTTVWAPTGGDGRPGGTAPAA